VAHPQAPGPQPAPGLPAPQAPRQALEAVREAAARPPRPARRQVHRPPGCGSRRKYYQFTAIDDCTRLRVLRIYPQLNQTTAIQFADYVLERLPFRVEVIQTDNGAEFQSRFHYHLLDKGVGHDYIKPRTPRLNGKVERSHRIDAEEFYQLLDGVVIDDTKVFNDKLREWENFYNYHRPHGGLGGQTPYERLKQRTQTRM
jgi:transposase InsO family protein